MINQRAMELLVQGRDLPWLLDQWVKRTPDKTCLIWAPREGEHRQWTYAQFDKELKQVAAGIEIAIRHEDGSDCQRGETGHLYVRGIRGITIFKEYYNNPEANEAAFDKDGWFDTGDRIRIGEDGHLYFSERNKNMLRVGGENIAASEIEAVIRQLAWVKECAVVGQKHAMLDEVPVTFVSVDSNAATHPCCRPTRSSPTASRHWPISKWSARYTWLTTSQDQHCKKLPSTS